jgi:hypothetical protein
MSTKLFNIPSDTLRPGPTLTIVRQPDGRTTATMDFTCRKFDIGRALVKTKLAKGNSLTSLYAAAGAEFSYLKLDGWTSRDEPGGITTVTCEFSGVDLGADGDASFESAVTYTRNNALREEPIYNLQAFIDLTATVQDGIRAAADGTGYYSDGDIKRSTNDEVICTLGSEGEKWYNLIVRRGNTTYLVPTSEWTKSATNRGQLSSATLNGLGKISTPPGSPAAPAGHSWMMTGATEQISVSGDGANSYSLTYTSGPWDTDIYN